MTRREKTILRIGFMTIALLGVAAWVIVRTTYDDTPSSTNSAGESSEGGFRVDDAPADIRGSIPRPNSGVAPQNPGDRGGYLQLGLLAVIVLGVSFIAYRVISEGRRNLVRQHGRPTAAEESHPDVLPGEQS